MPLFELNTILHLYLDFYLMSTKKNDTTSSLTKDHFIVYTVKLDGLNPP